MPLKNTPSAKLTTIAEFPIHYFLENLAVRADGSILVSELNHKGLWYVPPVKGNTPVKPSLLFTFDQLLLSTVEVEPDIWYVFTSNGYTDHQSSLYRLDLRGWAPGKPVNPERILRFPETVRCLNGGCLIGPRTILISDSLASLIWRVDLSPEGRNALATVWLRHYSMLNHPGQTKPEQPGVNGVRFAAKTNYLYYTSTTLQLFMRVRVDAETLAPLGEPEYIGGGTMMDDFCIDEEAGVAYVTTHRENTIDRMYLEPGKNTARHSVAGDPFTDQLIGPSSGVWGRGPGEYGRLAYFTTDGGTTAPPADGVVRPAKLLRVEFA